MTFLSFCVILFTLGLVVTVETKPCDSEDFRIICEGNTERTLTMINSIKLFRISPYATYGVFIALKYPDGDITEFSINWVKYGETIKHRASLSKSIIYPVHQAKLVLEIHKDDYKKEDAGDYQCEIKGLEGGKPINESYTIKKQGITCTNQDARGDSGIISSSLRVVSAILVVTFFSNFVLIE